jgi:hypothetical protein
MPFSSRAIWVRGRLFSFCDVYLVLQVLYFLSAEPIFISNIWEGQKEKNQTEMRIIGNCKEIDRGGNAVGRLWSAGGSRSETSSF